MALVVAGLLSAVALARGDAARADELATARAQALRAAQSFATALTTYDYRTLDRDFAAVRKRTTASFTTEYDKAGSGLAEVIKKYHATSSGTVVASGVSEISPQRAVVLLFVDQKVSNTQLAQPRVDRNRMRLVLVHRNGQWLVSSVQLM